MCKRGDYKTNKSFVLANNAKNICTNQLICFTQTIQKRVKFFSEIQWDCDFLLHSNILYVKGTNRFQYVYDSATRTDTKSTAAAYSVTMNT